MPATDFQGSSVPHPSRLFMRLRRDRIHSLDSSHDLAKSQEQELEAFQKHVAEKFNELSSAGPDEILSLAWIHKLLNAFISCQEEFMDLLFSHKANLNKPPMDRLVSEFFDRNVKALDVCNAIRDGIEQIRQWQKQLEIVLCALETQKSLGEGQFRRAKKALVDLAIEMLDEKESSSSIANRNRSFGRSNVHKDYKSLIHYRSLSWSVSRSWSAARQLQAISNNLVAPRPNEVIASNGLAVSIFTMNFVLYFVMWALVAAIPCQDRGLQTPFHVGKQFVWANSILSLHERILEESKKRERRSASGLLKEIYEIEKCARRMNELIDFVKFPLNSEKEDDARGRVKEVRVVYECISEGLNPLEKQIREVFQRIMRSRTEGLNFMGIGKSTPSSSSS